MQILLNVSCYINDKDTIILINKAKEIELDFETKIFLIKTEPVTKIFIVYLLKFYSTTLYNY